VDVLWTSGLQKSKVFIEHQAFIARRDATMKRIDPSEYQNIVVLTGAGISVASGLPSYRGPEGIWNDEDTAKYAMVDTWLQDPLDVWQAFGGMREHVMQAEPNPAHEALAEFEAACPGSFTLVTQNVDGLHIQAGSENVVELHGNLRTTRCSNPACESEPFTDSTTTIQRLPRCEQCGDLLRPDIVLFGEWLPPDAERATKMALRDCDLFIAIGTSGTVTPAANFVRSADYAGARTILVNLEKMEPANPYFQEEILGRAEELLPDLLST
jgi:NAD-dependent deacetylase